MTDEIINELWRIKDNIACDYGYDLDRLVADLRSKEQIEKTRNRVDSDSAWPDSVKALAGAWRDDRALDDQRHDVKDEQE